ncbi:MAG TPA: hypothetical protein VE075_03180 [Thermoanaerobaculia bacterium]|nr:hypothetical protein [Thermoanaerobaculia bacterium]
MDKENLFFTRRDYNLERLDWAILMLLAFVLLVMHWREVNWWQFVVAFLFPDLIGTLPGLYTYYARRKGEHRSVPAAIHRLYDFGHSFAGVALFCALWWLASGRWEWAMLAFPIHLGGDRSIFGNIYKPLGTAFEPVKHDAFRRFEKDYQSAGNW